MLRYLLILPLIFCINIFADVSEFGKLLKSNTFLVTPYSFKNQGGVDGFFMACLMKKSNLI